MIKLFTDQIIILINYF